jgi:hypothetical protein
MAVGGVDGAADISPARFRIVRNFHGTIGPSASDSAGTGFLALRTAFCDWWTLTLANSELWGPK